MYLGDGDCRSRVLGQGVLEKACVCPAQDDAVVRAELYVHYLLVMGSSYGDVVGRRILTGESMVDIMAYA